MTSRGLIAYDPNGRVFALAHDEEILVHDGGTEGPLWRRSLGEGLVGVAIAADDIVAVGEAGGVFRFTFLNRELARSALGPGVTTFALRADGAIAAAHAEHVSLLRKNDLAPVELYHRGVTALAWSSDGKKLLLAKSADETAHALVLLEGANGEPEGQPRAVAERVDAIAASPKGGFLVASGDRLLRFTGPDAEPTPVTRAKDQRITDVACSADGGRFAVQVDRSKVVVLADPPADTLLSLEYPQRVCAGVAFGPRPWLGVALGGGDANKCNVDTGDLHRSDTHPGRTHQRWLVMVGGAFRAREAAAAKAPAPAPSAADAAAAAAAKRKLERELDEAERQLRESSASDGDGKMIARGALIGVGILLGLLRACSRDRRR